MRGLYRPGIARLPYNRATGFDSRMATHATTSPRLYAARAYRSLGLLGTSTVLVAALICVPIVAVVSNVFAHGGDTWRHLLETVLPGYVANTAALVLGVAYGV